MELGTSDFKFSMLWGQHMKNWEAKLNNCGHSLLTNVSSGKLNVTFVSLEKQKKKTRGVKL